MDQSIYNERSFCLNNEQHFSNNALFWIELANRRLFDFSSQLFGIASIILPLSVSILAIKADLLEREEVLIMLGWLFLGLSLIFGLKQVLKDAGFFITLSNDSSLRGSKWANWNKHSKEIKETIGEIPPTPSASSHNNLYLQIFTLSTGIIFLMIVAASLLIRHK